jgi:hypothetical protein
VNEYQSRSAREGIHRPVLRTGAELRLDPERIDTGGDHSPGVRTPRPGRIGQRRRGQRPRQFLEAAAGTAGKQRLPRRKQVPEQRDLRRRAGGRHRRPDADQIGPRRQQHPVRPLRHEAIEFRVDDLHQMLAGLDDLEGEHGIALPGRAAAGEHAAARTRDLHEQVALGIQQPRLAGEDEPLAGRGLEAEKVRQVLRHLAVDERVGLDRHRLPAGVVAIGLDDDREFRDHERPRR